MSSQQIRGLSNDAVVASEKCLMLFSTETVCAHSENQSSEGVALPSSLQKSIALPSRCYYLRCLLNVTLPTVGYRSGRGLCFDLGRC